MTTIAGATCESQGGECKRGCNGGDWDFSLTCSNNKRLCCFTEGSATPAPTPPPASVDPSTIPGQGIWLYYTSCV